MGFTEIFGLIIVFAILYLVVSYIVLPIQRKFYGTIDKATDGLSHKLTDYQHQQTKSAEEINQTNKRSKL